MTSRLLKTALLVALTLLNFSAFANRCNTYLEYPPSLKADNFYLDEAGSIVDSKIAEQNRASLKAIDNVVWHLHKSIKLGDEDCVKFILENSTQANMMLGPMLGPQANVERLWRASSISVLTMIWSTSGRNIDPKTKSWISSVATAVYDDFSNRTNNIRSWTTLVQIAAGVAIKDSKLIEKGRLLMERGLRDLDLGNGFVENSRGSLSWHYKNMYLTPLVASGYIINNLTNQPTGQPFERRIEFEQAISTDWQGEPNAPYYSWLIIENICNKKQHNKEIPLPQNFSYMPLGGEVEDFAKIICKQ